MQEFIEQMADKRGYFGTIPARPIPLYAEKKQQLRNFDFILTWDECMKLREDPRVMGTRWGTKKEVYGNPVPCALEPERLYARSKSQNSYHFNWAFPECTAEESRFPDGVGPIAFRHSYSLTGKGVDVVIQDTGIMWNHCEWEELESNETRLRDINWPQIAGFDYDLPNGWWEDYSGHGTHVAGTTAGKYLGWAKEAHIYNMKILRGTSAAPEMNTDHSVTQIKVWHQRKNDPNDPLWTGQYRPTIVNMSWGWIDSQPRSGYIKWRDEPEEWFEGLYPEKGIAWYGNNQGGGASFWANMEDAVDVGVVFVGAAGNDRRYISVPGHPDYDNYVSGRQNSSEWNRKYYTRPASPSGVPGVVCVGAIDVGPEQWKCIFSNTGPRIDVWAPGSGIQSAIPRSSDIGSRGSVRHPINPDDWIIKIEGTSMASPEVCGVVATVLELHPEFTSEDARQWVQANAVEGRLYAGDSGNVQNDYGDFRSQVGSENLYLNTPFRRSETMKMSGQLKFYPG